MSAKRRKNIQKVYSFLISSEREAIYKNCDIRFNQMLNNGGLEEVIKLREQKYG